MDKNIRASFISKFKEVKNWKEEILFLRSFLATHDNVLEDMAIIEGAALRDILHDVDVYRDAFIQKSPGMSLDNIRLTKDDLTDDIIDYVKNINLWDILYTNDDGEYVYTKEFLNLTPIIEYWVTYAKENHFSTIAFIEAEKFFAYDYSFVGENQDIDFLLYVTDSIKYNALTMIFGKYGNVTVRRIQSVTDEQPDVMTLYDNRFVLGDIDLICAMPDKGRKYFTQTDDAKIGTVRKETVAVQHLLDSISTKNVLNILLPSAYLFASEYEGSRAHLIPEKEHTAETTAMVRKIIQLPTLKAYSSINMNLIEMVKTTQRKDSYAIEVAEMVISDTVLAVNGVKHINSSFLSGGKSWNVDDPSGYMAADGDNAVETISIKEIGIALRGKAISNKDLDPAGAYLVINLSNVQDGKLVFGNEAPVIIQERKPKSLLKYEVNPGDVVVACRGTVLKSAYVPYLHEEDEREIYLAKTDKELMSVYQMIASVNLLIINIAPDSKILPKYLNLIFNLPAGQKLLENIQRGDVIKNINSDDLMNLEIPYFDKEIQLKIIAEYEKILVDYKESQKKWASSIARINTSIILGKPMGL